LGNAFFGVGAFFTAMIVGIAQEGRGYRIAGHLMALVMLALVIPALAAHYPAVGSGFEFHRAIALLGNAVVVVAALAFFMNTGIENTMGNWISTLGTSIGYSERGANMLLSAFWASTMISRLATASLISPQTGAIVSAALAMVVFGGIAAMSGATSKLLACLLVLMVGAAVGPITPTVTGVMFSKLPPDVFGSAFAIFFAIGLVGATSIPAGVGLASRQRPIQKAMPIPMLAAVLLGLFALLLNGL
jgi:hypothetical protein